MAMKMQKLKDKVELWSTFLKVLKNNKGVETRVLVYIIAAVALAVSLGIVISTLSGSGSLVDTAMRTANDTMLNLTENLPTHHS